MIDSLQTFFDASEGDGEGEGDAALLVQYLASLAADASLPCAVVVLAQSQPAPCPAAEPATTLAQYMAKLVLEVGPLQSGHSSAVHGQVVMYVLHTNTHACMHACRHTCRRGTPRPCMGRACPPAEAVRCTLLQLFLALAQGCSAVTSAALTYACMNTSKCIRTMPTYACMNTCMYMTTRSW
mgnify:CR=1 FL=1